MPRYGPPSPELRQYLAEASRRAWVDPEKRRRMTEGIRRGKAQAGELLPDMTADQQHRYVYLRQRIGREKALAEVLRPRA